MSSAPRGENDGDESHSDEPVVVVNDFVPICKQKKKEE